jgi:CheY-like chemotaxis protein
MRAKRPPAIEAAVRRRRPAQTVARDAKARRITGRRSAPGAARPRGRIAAEAHILGRGRAGGGGASRQRGDRGGHEGGLEQEGHDAGQIPPGLLEARQVVRERMNAMPMAAMVCAEEPRGDVVGEHVEEGEAALDRLAAAAFDLVVLDVGLPDVDGVEVCRRARAEHPRLAILILTARSSELDEVLGLDAGAHDYLTRPFSLSVLSARVRALLRRRGGAGDRELEVGDVRVDPAARRTCRDGRELDLSPKEFDSSRCSSRAPARPSPATRS